MWCKAHAKHDASTPHDSGLLITLLPVCLGCFLPAAASSPFFRLRPWPAKLAASSTCSSLTAELPNSISASGIAAATRADCTLDVSSAVERLPKQKTTRFLEFETKRHVHHRARSIYVRLQLQGITLTLTPWSWKRNAYCKHIDCKQFQPENIECLSPRVFASRVIAQRTSNDKLNEPVELSIQFHHRIAQALARALGNQVLGERWAKCLRYVQSTLK